MKADLTFTVRGVQVQTEFTGTWKKLLKRLGEIPLSGTPVELQSHLEFATGFTPEEVTAKGDYRVDV